VKIEREGKERKKNKMKKNGERKK